MLSCDCREYPVIAGIPLLFPDAVAERDVNVQHLISLIRAGKTQQALVEVLTPKELGPEGYKKTDRSLLYKLLPSSFSKKMEIRHRNSIRKKWQSTLLELADSQGPGSTIELFQHYFKVHTAGQRAADYFSYRFGQPKYLTTLSLAESMPISDGRVIDLGCGAGHFTRNLLLRNKGELVYGVDQDFFLLWIANTRIAPGAQYICANLEFGLPFRSRIFSSILMSNFFQFLYGKKQLAVESERTLIELGGVIIISSLRHSGFSPPTPNQAISIENYQQLFSMPSVAVSDDDVLSKYIEGHGPNLTGEVDLAALKHAPLISIVASNMPQTFKQYGDFNIPPHQLGNPSINPLYKEVVSSEFGAPESSVKGNANFEIVWPSKQFIEDNEGIDRLLPSSLNSKKAQSLKSDENFGIYIDYPKNY